jgi:hypothetical protein
MVFIETGPPIKIQIQKTCFSIKDMFLPHADTPFEFTMPFIHSQVSPVSFLQPRKLLLYSSGYWTRGNHTTESLFKTFRSVFVCPWCKTVCFVASCNKKYVFGRKEELPQTPGTGFILTPGPVTR